MEKVEGMMIMKKKKKKNGVNSSGGQSEVGMEKRKLLLEKAGLEKMLREIQKRISEVDGLVKQIEKKEKELMMLMKNKRVPKQKKDEILVMDEKGRKKIDGLKKRWMSLPFQVILEIFSYLHKYYPVNITIKYFKDTGKGKDEKKEKIVFEDYDYKKLTPSSFFKRAYGYFKRDYSRKIFLILNHFSCSVYFKVERNKEAKLKQFVINEIKRKRDEDQNVQQQQQQQGKKRKLYHVDFSRLIPANNRLLTLTIHDRDYSTFLDFKNCKTKFGKADFSCNMYLGELETLKTDILYCPVIKKLLTTPILEFSNRCLKVMQRTRVAHFDIMNFLFKKEEVLNVLSLKFTVAKEKDVRNILNGSFPVLERLEILLLEDANPAIISNSFFYGNSYLGGATKGKSFGINWRTLKTLKLASPFAMMESTTFDDLPLSQILEFENLRKLHLYVGIYFVKNFRGDSLRKNHSLKRLKLEIHTTEVTDISLFSNFEKFYSKFVVDSLVGLEVLKLYHVNGNRNTEFYDTQVKLYEKLGKKKGLKTFAINSFYDKNCDDVVRILKYLFLSGMESVLLRGNVRTYRKNLENVEVQRELPYCAQYLQEYGNAGLKEEIDSFYKDRNYATKTSIEVRTNNFKRTLRSNNSWDDIEYDEEYDYEDEEYAEVNEDCDLLSIPDITLEVNQATGTGWNGSSEKEVQKKETKIEEDESKKEVTKTTVYDEIGVKEDEVKRLMQTVKKKKKNESLFENNLYFLSELLKMGATELFFKRKNEFSCLEFFKLLEKNKSLEVISIIAEKEFLKDSDKLKALTYKEKNTTLKNVTFSDVVSFDPAVLTFTLNNFANLESLEYVMVYDTDLLKKDDSSKTDLLDVVFAIKGMKSISFSYPTKIPLKEKYFKMIYEFHKNNEDVSLYYENEKEFKKESYSFFSQF